MYYGVVSVPIYQSNDIIGGLITIVSYVIIKQQPLQGYLVRLIDVLNTPCRYVSRVTYVRIWLRSFGAKGQIQRKYGGSGVSGWLY